MATPRYGDRNSKGRLSGLRDASLPGALLLLLAVAPLNAACDSLDSLDPFAEDEQVARPADSAARASFQTYGLLARAVKRQERLEAREAKAAAAAEAPHGPDAIETLPPQSEPDIALRVQFAEHDAELNPNARAELAALGAELQRVGQVPIKLLAYWSADDDETAGPAKIRALKRAMVVRDFLTDQGLGRAPIEFPRVEGDEDAAPDVIDVVLETR